MLLLVSCVVILHALNADNIDQVQEKNTHSSNTCVFLVAKQKVCNLVVIQKKFGNVRNATKIKGKKIMVKSSGLT